MTSPSKINVQPYVRAPLLSAWKAIVLCLRLLLAAPADLSARTRAALEMVRTTCVELQTAARQRLKLSPESLRRFDAPLDSGWVGLRMALEAVARLTGTPEADRATILLARMLPNGTNFVQFAYERQWTESENHLIRIDEERLEAEVVALVGPLFLPFIRSAHAAFGEALGLGSTPISVADTTAVGVAVDQVSFAIAEYGRMMVGELDRNDPASVERFKKAMAPIDAYRAANSRTTTNEEEDLEVLEDLLDVDPIGPIPPVPGDPSSPTEG